MGKIILNLINSFDLTYLSFILLQECWWIVSREHNSSNWLSNCVRSRCSHGGKSNRYTGIDKKNLTAGYSSRRHETIYQSNNWRKSRWVTILITIWRVWDVLKEKKIFIRIPVYGTITQRTSSYEWIFLFIIHFFLSGKNWKQEAKKTRF